ncbi:MAG TPA: aminotransferase class I/II-fold pyridoxal phosphate-dependent enzyme [Holophaga sp.]|nr:aminotransferase class I/II-fold pyridoxal phosphate-dependent enzyme [Holophaga sp.]
MSATQVAELNPLAQIANESIRKDCPAVFELLGERGKRFFFPTKGILAQGAEAKQKAKVANATIGIATENGEPMYLACVHRYFSGLTSANLYDYAPSYGKPALRQAWAQKQREETPSLGGQPVSNPVVTNALTHGLSTIGELFLDPGDEVLSGDLLWENYNLAWETRLGAHISYYPFFDAGLKGFNLEAFSQALKARLGRKLVVSLNFPNNPSGYTPTKAEALGIVRALTEAAEAGSRLVVVCDDAYYGMFFDEACEKESLFGRLAQAHPNLLAVKVDGGTKEAFVWGMRVGFITYGVKNGTPAAYKALEDKTAGVIRAMVSSVTHPGQTIVLKALQDPDFRRQQAEKVEILRQRAEATGVACRRAEYADCWDVYPYNSGYFMCLRLKDADADTVRMNLLDEHGVGTIALGPTNLRVAFSCLTEAQIPGVFKAIAAAVRTVRGR